MLRLFSLNDNARELRLYRQDRNRYRRIQIVAQLDQGPFKMRLHYVTPSMKKYALLKTALVCLLASCSKKEKVSEITVEIEMPSAQFEYRSTPDGNYQIFSSKLEARTQLWVDGVKSLDETETDEDLPDTAAGEFESVSFEWKDDRTLRIREQVQDNMDELGADAPPLKWDKTYELEILRGSKEDFEAGRTISVRYTEVSMELVKKDMGEKFKTYFDESIPVLFDQVVDGDVDKTFSLVETEVETVNVANPPSKLSNSSYVVDSKDYASVRIKWTFYKTK